ncbi:MAG: U32 family peptidase [Bacteroidia bacterium]|nr:U32 family peptidase [Bacteroidia bacterium]
MAPVGSWESLAAAIQAGAGSVYFGIEKLNMRAKSSINFTIDDLQKIVSICNEKNIKTYLTLNTVIYNDDVELMKTIVDAAKVNGITAIIASDQSVIYYARSVGMEIHISTQVNISNIEAVRFYAHFADVMVLARELSLRQVAEITRQIKEQQIKGPSGKLVRIEIFVHGALCMAISGKCYMSLHEYNHSANRGSCLQTCRRSYIVTDKESGYELEIDNEYIMSPKDLCTIGFLDLVMEAGVEVMKIEGRARPPEYVKTVTVCYREAIDSYFDKSYSAEKIKAWEQRLATVFNRGFWEGYYLGEKMGEWSRIYRSGATRRKQYVGKVTNYFSNIGVAEFLLEAGALQVGDEILVTGPTTGVVETQIIEMHLDNGSVADAPKGAKVSVKTDQLVRRADKLYKVVKMNYFEDE